MQNRILPHPGSVGVNRSVITSRAALASSTASTSTSRRCSSQAGISESRDVRLLMTGAVSLVVVARKAMARALLALAALASAREVELRAPLTTIIAADAAPPPGDGVLSLVVDLDVPADAPEDLGIGAFVADRHGGWFQRCRDGRLEPGRRSVRIALDP